jgi:hypothetical protein
VTSAPRVEIADLLVSLELPAEATLCLQESHYGLRVLWARGKQYLLLLKIVGSFSDHLFRVLWRAPELIEPRLLGQISRVVSRVWFMVSSQEYARLAEGTVFHHAGGNSVAIVAR